MSILSSLFTTSRERTKRNVARELNGVLLKTQPGHTVVLSSIRGWGTVVDINSPEGEPVVFFGPRPATRIGIPLRALDGFCFEMRRRGLVGQALYDRRMKWKPDQASTREAAFQAEIQHRLRPPDISLGYGEFDYEFSLEANDEQKVRQLLSNGELRASLQEQRSVYIKLAQDDEWFDSLWQDLPDDVAVLYFQSSSVIKDVDRIKRLHHLLATAVEQLVEIGSASPAAPHLSSRPT